MPKTKSLRPLPPPAFPRSVNAVNDCYYTLIVAAAQILGFILASSFPHIPHPFQEILLAANDISRIVPPPLPSPWPMPSSCGPWILTGTSLTSLPPSVLASLQSVSISQRTSLLDSEFPETPHLTQSGGFMWSALTHLLAPLRCISDLFSCLSPYRSVLFSHIDLAIPLTYLAVCCFGSLCLLPLPWILFQRHLRCSSGVW